MNIINITIRFLSKLISYLIPIDKHLFVFTSQIGYGDNSFGFFIKLLIKNKNLKYTMVWLVKDPAETIEKIKEDVSNLKRNFTNIKCIKRKSFKGIWYCYRAKYIFNTSGIYSMLYFRNSKRINFWHGMPFKTIGNSNNSCGDFSIATSDIFKKAIANGLKIPLNNVIIAGQPRNDLMFLPKLYSFPFLKGYKKVGIWTPTFRKTLKGEYSDGDFSDSRISIFPFNELKNLSNFLVENNTLLIIKLHPMDLLQTVGFPENENIIIFNNANFDNRKLYPLLSYCDFLITDFSSIAIDYEILGRPMAFIIDDLKQYENKRGFIFKDFPGAMIKNQSDFYNFILKVINDSYIIPKDKTYNFYKDDKSSERIMDYFKI